MKKKKKAGKARVSRRPDNDAQQSLPPSLPVVGIGASAGGLEALTEFFLKLPPNMGMAFVVVQHLDPKHSSILSELIGKKTKMGVEEATDGLSVRPNRVYIIPPNALIELFHGKLQLQERKEAHKAIDIFFQSLARDQGNLSVGILFSGTGSDGTEGLREIKAEGGVTFVQSPETAKFDGMPRSAISAGVADHVLSPSDIAKELNKIAASPLLSRGGPRTDLSSDFALDSPALQKIFAVLRARRKIDFSLYKSPTITRRIKRRMLLNRISDLNDYVTFLSSQDLEVGRLFDDLLINVTSFFRDPETFNILKKRIFPEILKSAGKDSIRIWVPACSTGEEVYSIAITLVETLGDSLSQTPVQVYGSDISDMAIKRARAGVYSDSISNNVSPERLRRFFDQEDGRYRISKRIRDLCIFSVQDVTRHPPINRLDLLSCRNLMIYLSPALQKRVLETFFYAIKPDRFLLLGSSESVGTFADLFETVDKKGKFYRKKSALAQRPYDFSSHDVSTLAVKPESPQTSTTRAIGSRELLEQADRAVLKKFTPPGVVVDQSMNVVLYRGSTGPYLEAASGQPSLNLLKMTRDGLATGLGMALRESIKSNKAVRKNGLRLRSNGNVHLVAVEVTPLVLEGMGSHYSVSFFEEQNGKTKLPSLSKKAKRGAAEATAEELEMGRLREELEITQKSLKAVIADQEEVNEALQTANEEVMSSNEELQSTNEEIETAKEELQSTNEELTTLNDELMSRNAELDVLNNDLNNLITSFELPIIIVDSELHIRRFTPEAAKTMNLIGSDVGRRLTDINLGFELSDLEKTVLDVIESITPQTFELKDRKGKWYSLRIRPYKTADKKISGAVMVFVDIDSLKKITNALDEAKHLSEAIVETVPEPLVVLDEHLNVVKVNTEFCRTFQVSQGETEGLQLYELGNGQWNIPELQKLLEQVLSQHIEVTDYKVEHKFEKIGPRTMYLNAKSLNVKGTSKSLILLAIAETVTQKTRSKANEKPAIGDRR